MIHNRTTSCIDNIAFPFLLQVFVRVTNSKGKVVHEAIYEREDRLLCDGLWMSLYVKLGRGHVSKYSNTSKLFFRENK